MFIQRVDRNTRPSDNPEHNDESAIMHKASARKRASGKTMHAEPMPEQLMHATADAGSTDDFDVIGQTPSGPTNQGPAMEPLERISSDKSSDGISSRLLTSMTAKMLKQTAELSLARTDLDTESQLRRTAEAAIATFEHRYAVAHEQSARYRKRAKIMSRRFICAQEEDRQNISRELHDVVAQSLTGIILRLSALAPENRIGLDAGHQDLSEVRNLIIHAVTVVQRFARDLRPSMLDDLGLTPALASFLEHVTYSTGIRTTLASVRLTGALNTEQRTAMFRVAQEACNNVARHAHATHIRVRIQRKADDLRMSIQDDGLSFPIASVLHAHGRKRLGLLGMRERMRILGGNLDITSTPRRGTCIIATVPMSKIGHKTSRRGTVARPDSTVEALVSVG